MDFYSFRVLQKVLIFRSEKVLILRRSANDDANPSFWDFPGGKLEKGESAQDAIKREVSEETSISIENLSIANVISFERNDLNFFGVLYLAQYHSGDVFLSSEHQDFKWVTIKELKNFETQPWLKQVLGSCLDLNS